VARRKDDEPPVEYHPPQRCLAVCRSCGAAVLIRVYYGKAQQFTRLPQAQNAVTGETHQCPHAWTPRMQAG
jgi:hypothetical protein